MWTGEVPLQRGWLVVQPVIYTKRQFPWRRVFMYASIGVVAVLALTVIVFFNLPTVVRFIDQTYPEFFDKKLGTERKSVERLLDPAYFAEASDIVSEDLTAVACISSPEHRILIWDPRDIPPLFEHAILASEDKSFFEHEGVDMRAIGRAAWMRLNKKSTSGASTLSMQMAKHLRGGIGRESTLGEKIQDALTALRMEDQFTKRQILLRYVNMPFIGRGYGIEVASREYFGKPARELEAYQVAFVVALIPSPRRIERAFASDSSIKDPKLITEANWSEMRFHTLRVLRRMHEDGHLNDVDYAVAREATETRLRKEVIPRRESCGATNYYTEHVRKTVGDLGFRVGEDGLKIFIPRDNGLENVLKQAVDEALRAYVRRHPKDEDNSLLRAGAYAMRLNGDMLALVGNIDFRKHQFDVMTLGARQPGSTFKMFVYGSLVEKLVDEVLAEEKPLTLHDLVLEVQRRCIVVDAPIGVYLGKGRGVKVIENFRSRTQPQYRGPISCTLAIAESRNTAAMRAGQRAGIPEVIELTHRLGMPEDQRRPLQPYPTTAIGASEVSPLGMSGACAFVSGGFKCTPRFVFDVCKHGKSLLRKEANGLPENCDVKGEFGRSPERVLHPAVAMAMSEILQGPLDAFTLQKNENGISVPYYGGSARGLRTGTIPGVDPLTEFSTIPETERAKRLLKFPKESSGEIACKTGTATNEDGKTSDVWLVCFVPGPSEKPAHGVMLVFWMGKDQKSAALGDRGTGTTEGFAETGGRNWVPSAALVLDFLRRERGLLKSGYKFEPILKDEALRSYELMPKVLPSRGLGVDPEVRVVDPADSTTPRELLEQLPKPEITRESATPPGGSR